MKLLLAVLKKLWRLYERRHENWELTERDQGWKQGNQSEGHYNNPGKQMFTWSGGSHEENEKWSELGEKD